MRPTHAVPDSAVSAVHPQLLARVQSVDKPLLELHAATEIGELWEATCRVMRGSLEADFFCLCLRPFELLPGTIFRDRHAFRSAEELQTFNRLSLLQPYVLAHPGLAVVRLSDVINEVDLVRTPFYRQCMEPCGYLHVAVMAFWQGRTLEGVVCAHRSRAAGGFTRGEMRALERLHPMFAIGLHRVLRLHRERTVRLSLERFLNGVPLATALLSWDLETIYANRSARETALAWQAGREAARAFKPPVGFCTPMEVLDACRNLRASWKPIPQNANPGVLGNTTVRAAADRALSATVSVLHFGATPQQRPTFLVQFDTPSSEASGDQGARLPNLSRLSRLSRCERELALLVCEGLNTSDLATRLCKSPLTIKKQLQSIYRKLEVPSRSRLMAILR